jgi:saccharopine dehydrogenase-like NADP-dependent oxidoreductase
MRKHVLVLGAGLVAPPLVKHLGEWGGAWVLLADIDGERARTLASSAPHIEAVTLGVENTDRVLKAIRGADLVISLLPARFHPRIAELCIESGRDLITASYVSPELRRLETGIQRSGIVVLCEVGLDPGIDHMEAMRLIHEIKRNGAEIRSFTSYCGGLPAPEANTNPLGYKFSWSPMGVLTASRSPARFLEGGRVVEVPPEDLFSSPRRFAFEAIGDLEGYPNRDSIPYVSLYGIPAVHTMLRGTLRYPGWCSFMRAAGILGYLDDTPRPIIQSKNFASYLKDLVGAEPAADPESALRSRLDRDLYSRSIAAVRWLGLMDNDPVPAGADSPLEVLGRRMQERLSFRKGERDMIVLHHRFEASRPDGRVEETVSTLVDFGRPDGDSAMARTVGLPVAVAAKLILNQKIGRKGLMIPIFPEIYRAVLEELQGFGIAFRVDRRPLPPADH